MATELVTMSKREIDVLEVIRKVHEQRLTQVKAGELLGLSDRQVRRLHTRYERDGAVGLVSKQRGRPSNHRLPDEFRDCAMAIVRERYAVTNREKRRVSEARAAADVDPRPTERPHLVPVPSEDGRLDAMLAYLAAFDEEQRAKRKLQNVRATLRRRGVRGSGLEWPADATQDEEQRC